MGKGNSSTTTQTTGLDKKSQQFVNQTRAGATAASDVALNNPGQFFLGADPRSVQDIIQPFMDPFQNQVIDATRAEFQTARDRAVGGAGGINQQAATAGAFGGSRQGVAQGVRLGELDRAEISSISGLMSQNFQQAVQNGIPFSQQQRALAQQQAQEPLFRHQQSQNFLNMGLGPTGQTRTTTEETSGNLFRDIAGAGLAVGGLLTGGAAPAVAGLAQAVTAGGRRRPMQPAFPPLQGFNFDAGTISPTLFPGG